MNTPVVGPPQARARAVEFVPDAFVVHLEDGPGTGIHWPDIDEDISIAGLLGLPDVPRDHALRSGSFEGPPGEPPQPREPR